PARLSGGWTRPTTVTVPVGAGGRVGAEAAPAELGGSQPRSIRMAVPSSSTSGVTISNPTRSLTVRLRARISCDGSYRPVTVTRAQAVPGAGGWPAAVSTEASGTGGPAASIRALTALR